MCSVNIIKEIINDTTTITMDNHINELLYTYYNFNLKIF